MNIFLWGEKIRLSGLAVMNANQKKLEREGSGRMAVIENGVGRLEIGRDSQST
jgi:hypothetical protein